MNKWLIPFFKFPIGNIENRFSFYSQLDFISILAQKKTETYSYTSFTQFSFNTIFFSPKFSNRLCGDGSFICGINTVRFRFIYKWYECISVEWILFVCVKICLQWYLKERKNWKSQFYHLSSSIHILYTIFFIFNFIEKNYKIYKLSSFPCWWCYEDMMLFIVVWCSNSFSIYT